MTKSSPATINPQSQCGLFTIPTELRNRIYSLAFSDEYGEIALHLATSPSNSLILACKAIEAEAHKVYIYSYRLYWTSHAFKVATNKPEFAIPKVQTLRHLDIDNIRNITFVSDEHEIIRKEWITGPGQLKGRNGSCKWSFSATYPAIFHGLGPSKLYKAVFTAFAHARIGADFEYSEHKDKTLLAKRDVVLFLSLLKPIESLSSWRDSVVN